MRRPPLPDVRSKLGEAALLALILSALGNATRPVVAVVATGSHREILQRRAVGLAPELCVAVMGGYRAVVADLLWLKAYLAWASRDGATMQGMIRLAVSADDRPLGFWLDGARMIAYDQTAWRLAGETVSGLPAAVASRIRETQARAALQLLEEARTHHPCEASICIEMANVELHVRRDLARASGWYREAALQPGAPHCAARIYAELLRRQGRNAEALAWLRRLHPTLSDRDPDAMGAIVLARIRELERTLEIPDGKRYAPSEIDGKLRSVQKGNCE